MKRSTFVIGLVIAVATPVLTAAATTDLSMLTDWRTFAAGIAVASVRQVALYLLDNGPAFLQSLLGNEDAST